MAQISSFDAPIKASSNDLIDSTVGIDPALLEFPNENLINVPQYNLFTQFSTINNFTNNWKMDNKFQHFNTFNNVQNISQNKIGNHLPKSSHTMRLWQRRMNSQKGKEKEFEALQDPHSEIDNSIQKGDSFTSYTPIDPSHTLVASDFQMKDVGHHNTSSSPAEFQHKQSLYGDNISSSSNKSCSPTSMFNGDESQLQILQESVSRKSGTTYIDQFIKNLLSQTQSQDASTTDPLQSFINFTSASHKQQGPSSNSSIDTKNKRMDTLLRESKDIYLQKSSEPSPKSPSSLQARGKGVIGKMIVPFVSGETIDGVNIWKEEGVHLRHVCPHAGCEKHFSTSGHARRHSRIHDRLHPFRCPHKGCYSTFTRRDNCTQHQSAKHKALLLAHRIKDVEL